MRRFRLFRWLLVGGVFVVLLAATSPWLVSAYWRVRSSHPVRRGVQKAAELGCFSCHGPLGTRGIAIPGEEQGVPAWSGGVWMMYVENDDEIRRYILDGSAEPAGEAERPERAPNHEHEADAPAGVRTDDGHGSHEHRDQDGGHAHPPQDQTDPGGGEAHADDERGHEHAVPMPAYRSVLRGSDLEDLVAAFKVLSGMSRPPADSAARRGYELARNRDCFSCHGPAGSGGLPNPGSFTGFVPGWYGADFRDLVRDRAEFDTWIREGGLPRLARHPIARYFLRRQKLPMPAYPEMTARQLDDLWAYTEWLARTEGGHKGTASW